MDYIFVICNLLNMNYVSIVKKSYNASRAKMMYLTCSSTNKGDFAT
jgi:hypothetical protein